jgi:hypothetical protein
MRCPWQEGEFPWPVKYGYASVGRVIDLGADVTGVLEGDLVFAFNPHETCYTVPTEVVIKLPRELNPRIGIFTANVETALNALLDATPRLGERVQELLAICIRDQCPHTSSGRESAARLRLKRIEIFVEQRR